MIYEGSIKMKKLYSAIIAISMAAAFVPAVSADTQTNENPLALEQILVSENFDGATITRPVTNTVDSIRLEGTDKFRYCTTNWGPLTLQSASIQDGAYHHTFTKASDTYQYAYIEKNLAHDVPLSLGDELHIEFDYMFTATRASNLGLIINGLGSVAYTPIKGSTGWQGQIGNMGSGDTGKLLHFGTIGSKYDTKPCIKPCGAESSVTIEPNKLYNVKLIIKTKDNEYDGKQTLTTSLTSADGTDIRFIGYLDADFKGDADRWGYVKKTDSDIDPITSFKTMRFTFESPVEAGYMILDNISVKKIRNGYDIKGDAVRNYGVVPDGFDAGKATVSLATDVSYYGNTETSGNFIVTQFDKNGRFVDANIKPVTISKSNRVASQEIDIKADTKKITGYFWDGKLSPFTVEGTLAQGVSPDLTGENSSLDIDFTDLSGIETVTANDDIFTCTTENAGFGRSTGTVYTIANSDASLSDTALNEKAVARPYKAIKITPTQLYPSASDTTVLDLSFAMDDVKSTKTVKVSSYNEDGTKGGLAEFVTAKQGGKMTIFGYPVKINDTAVTLSAGKWYNLKLYINKADVKNGIPNTFDAYLDGQLVLSDKAFGINGDNFGKWYGFSEIEIGLRANRAYSLDEEGNKSYIDNYFADKLYIGGISYGINNKAAVNSVIDSNNPYYVNLIDNTKGIIYDGGQDFASFAKYMKTDGISSPEKVSDTYFKMTDAKGGDIYYKIVDLPDSLSSYSVKDIDRDVIENNKYNPDLSNYYVYEQPLAIEKGSALDASFTLGNAETINANGFVYADGDRFMLNKNTADKSDDIEIKFWGTNIGTVGAFPNTHEEAEKLADSVAAAGFNLVRFHRIDGGETPSLWGYTSDGTKIDEESWDKFSYLIKCLKDRGVYYYIDQMVSMLPRQYKYGVGNVSGLDDVDGLGAGLAPICYFNEHAIEMQKELSRMLLTKENKYTGLSFANDPGMAMMDLKNESSIQSYTWVKYDSGKYSVVSGLETYYEELCDKYTTWLKKVRYYEENGDNSDSAIDSRIKSAWGSNLYPFTAMDPNESVSKKVRFGLTHVYGSNNKRYKDEDLFMKYIMDNYLDTMLTYLKNDVGVKCAITGNTQHGTAAVQSAHINASNTDFTDVHTYWGHPSGGNLDDSGTNVAPYNQISAYTWVGNVSMLEGDIVYSTNSEGVTSTIVGNLGMIGQLASARTSGKPYVISEWLDCAGTATHAEGSVMISAFASMHKWNPLSFAWNATMDNIAKLEDGYVPILESAFNATCDPVQRAMFPAAAIMFNRGDVQEATSGYYETYANDDEIYVNGNNIPGKDGITLWEGYHFFKNLSRQALIGKTGIQFYNVTPSATSDSSIDTQAVANTEKEKNGESVTYTSQTGELITDLGNSIFKVNTAKSQAITGYIGGKTVETDNLKLNVTNNFAAVIMTSLNDNSIASSNRVLLSMTGNSRNYGQLLSDDGKYIKIAGRDNILTEQIVGTVTLKGVSGNYKVYSLNSDGSRKAEIAVTNNGNTISFTLTRDTKAMNFEIVK